MSEVQFDEENFSQSAQFETKSSKFAGIVIKMGLAKDEKGANIFLVSISLVFLAISLFLFLRVFGVLG
jgi:hypothetical protein